MTHTWTWESENGNEMVSEIEFEMTYTAGNGHTFFCAGEQDDLEVEITSVEGDEITSEEEEKFLDFVYDNYFYFAEQERYCYSGF